MLNNNSILTWFVVDQSGSMITADFRPSRIAAAGDAALAYVQNLAGRGAVTHQGAVIAFHTKSKLLLPPTDIARIEAFEEAVAKLDAGGGTDFAEGLKPVIAALDGSTALDGSKRRGFLHWLFGSSRKIPVDVGMSHRVVFLSDGHTCGPKKEARSSARTLKDAGVVIETIGVGGDPADVDEALLKEMASLDPSGQPMYRFIGDRQALLQEFEAKAAQLQVC